MNNYDLDYDLLESICSLKPVSEDHFSFDLPLTLHFHETIQSDYIMMSHSFLGIMSLDRNQTHNMLQSLHDTHISSF